MIAVEAFSELLHALYSAPLQQEHWPQFLTLLCRHTQSATAVSICADSRLGPSIRSKANDSVLLDEGVTAYNERYAHADPFRAVLIRNRLAGVLPGDDIVPFDALQRTGMYRDTLAPFSGRYATIVILSVTLRRFEVISIWRTFDQGPMDEDSNRLLNLLLPHVQQALEIRQILGVAQQRLAGAEAMADASATATFLLSRKGRVLHRNAAADSLLRQSGALAILDGVLVAVEPRFSTPLSKLFHDAASSISSQWQARPALAMALHRSTDSQPLQLLASPLPRAHRCHSNADLVLLVTDPGEAANFPDDVLRSLYGLSSAQTEVANGLLTGYSLDEIATLRCVSVGTVRQQIKSIFNKTGTSRQSDLVRLLMTLPRPASAK